MLNKILVCALLVFSSTVFANDVQKENTASKVSGQLLQSVSSPHPTITSNITTNVTTSHDITSVCMSNNRDAGSCLAQMKADGHMGFCNLDSSGFDECLSSHADILVKQDSTHPRAMYTYILKIKTTDGNVASSKIFVGEDYNLHGKVENTNLEFDLKSKNNNDYASLNYHLIVPSSQFHVDGSISLKLGESTSIPFGKDAVATITRI